MSTITQDVTPEQIDQAIFARFELTEPKINKLLAHTMTVAPMCKSVDMMWRIGSLKGLPTLEVRNGLWGTWKYGGGAFTRDAGAIQLIELTIPLELRDAYCSNLVTVLQVMSVVTSEEKEGDEPMPPTELIFLIRTATPALCSIAMYITISEAVTNHE